MERTKKITTINIYSNILQHSKKHKINLSKFLCDKYDDEFMNESSLRKELKELDLRRNKIINDLEKYSARKINITSDELNNFRSINDKLERGAKWESLLVFHNNTFNRSYSLPEFKDLVEECRVEV